MPAGVTLPLLAAEAAAATAPVMTPEKVTHLLEAFKAAAEGSATMVTWALTAIIATIAAIVSTSYWRPAGLVPRLIYWLYLPGWVFLASSIYYGDSIARRNIAAHFGKPEALSQIAEGLNSDYICQQNCLTAGLTVFGLWLLLYLLWWIHGNWKTSNK